MFYIKNKYSKFKLIYILNILNINLNAIYAKRVII